MGRGWKRTEPRLRYRASPLPGNSNMTASVHWPVIQNGRAELISRNVNPFNSFADLCKGLTLPLGGKTVLDGEIVCLDKRGRPQFRDLLFHGGEPCVEQHGTALFQRVCKMDLEGIVAKHSLAPYTTERTTWFKIKNRSYSHLFSQHQASA